MPTPSFDHESILQSNPMRIDLQLHRVAKPVPRCFAESSLGITTFPSSPLNFPTAPLMDLLLSTLTGAPIILLACQPTAQRPMLVQTELSAAGHQGDTGEELTLVVAERRLRLVTTTHKSDHDHDRRRLRRRRC